MKTLMIAAACAALGAAPALAQPVAQGARPPAGWRAFDGGPAVLPAAIDRIEADQGGRVMEIRFSDRGGVPAFEAAVLKNGTITFERFAQPAAGVSVMTADQLPAWSLPWRGRVDARWTRRAAVSLDEAVRTAERAAGGAPAVAAGIARSASNPASDVHAYNVLVKTAGGVRRIAVDSQTGEVIADPGALQGWP